MVYWRLRERERERDSFDVGIWLLYQLDASPTSGGDTFCDNAHVAWHEKATLCYDVADDQCLHAFRIVGE